MLGKIKARGALGMVGWQDIIASEKALKIHADSIMKLLYAQSFRIYFSRLLVLHMLARLNKEEK